LKERVLIISSLLKKCGRWIFDARCFLCGGHVFTDIYVCKGCFEDLPWLKNGCFQCALPLRNTDVGTLCGVCLQTSYAFDRVVSAFSYDFPIAGLIARFKFGGVLACGELLANLLMLTVNIHYASSPLPEILIPMPLHKSRLQERGYNQAIVLGTVLSKRSSIPIFRKNLSRIRHTVPQTKIMAQERRANVERAFQANEILGQYKHIALIDDVITTTQTVNAAARAIRRVSDCQIDVWSVARTLPFRDRMVNHVYL